MEPPATQSVFRADMELPTKILRGQRCMKKPMIPMDLIDGTGILPLQEVWLLPHAAAAVDFLFSQTELEQDMVEDFQ